MTDTRTGAEWFADKAREDTETLRRRIAQMQKVAAGLRAIGCRDVEVGPGGITGRGPAPPPPGRIYISPDPDLIAAREARELEAEVREAAEQGANVERPEI